MEVLEQPEEINDSPIEQVKLTVPITDDTTLQVLTFRTWVLGLTACAFLAFAVRIFDYRQNNIAIPGSFVQILVFVAGKMMAATLPNTTIRVPGTRWSFSLNPGAFNVKEHVLISMLVDCGLNDPIAVEALTITKIFYHREIRPMAAYLLTQTSQLIGYGCAGLFMKLLVDNPYMWWPSTLADATFYRTLYETKVRRPKGQLTRMQFFLAALLCTFTYHLVPYYFFPSISALSFVCWIWKNSVTAQQLGSAQHGLGIGSLTLDWATAAWMGNPLTYPAFTLQNTMLGFIIFVYIVTPIVYWTNSYGAKTYPIISSHLFDDRGQIYNITRVLDERSMKLDQVKLESYSKVHLSPFFAYRYGFTFTSASAALTHVLLFHGRDLCSQFKKAFQNQAGDVHTRIMKNYASVPQWWYYLITILIISLSIFNSHLLGQQFQFPWWGVLASCVMAMVLVLPSGVITATTNMAPPLQLIPEFIIGYMYPGRPFGCLIFKGYTLVMWSQVIEALRSFKLGVYMKIPPRSMLMVQLVGIVVASSVNISTAWWLLSTVDHICEPSKLPVGSPWTCVGMDTQYDSTLIWGALGPGNIYAPNGLYSNMYLFFIIGVAATTLLWVLIRIFPNKKWIKSVHMPIIFAASQYIPPAPAASYWAWWAIGSFFNVVVYMKFKGWWAKYTYVLGSALDAGTGILALFLFFSFQQKDIYGVTWWGLSSDDHCPLAKCPTQPGIEVDGCPVF